MLQLFVDLLERVGFLIATAFVISRSRWMRGYMNYTADRSNHWRFIVFFSLYAMLGTYSGVEVTSVTYRPAPWIGEIAPQAAIANARTVGVVIAGLVGGVRSGLIVGLAAGIHRYSLGGFVALACMIAPIIQGVLAGLCRKTMKRYRLQGQSVKVALVVGLAAESLQQVLILLLARPFEEAWGLVSLIWLPQMLTNSVGVALFFTLYHTMEMEEDRIATEHARKALQIADRTLPYWKKPFDEAVSGVAAVILEETSAIGVFYMDQKGEAQAFEGRKTEYWIDVPIETENKKMLGRFRSYYLREHELTPYRRTMMKSLSQLLSQQLAFVEAERQAKLLADAEIRTLQAQMHPHFLFNVLNTVKSFIRTKPEEARTVVTQLAKFLRTTMAVTREKMIPLREELDLVLSYLNLTKARLGEQLHFETEIDEQALDCPIPPFTIQPLVENAVVHGVSGLSRQGIVKLTVKREGSEVRIEVSDNGKGMAEAWPRMQLPDVSEETHSGVALNNVEQRLAYHYGSQQSLHVVSEAGQGTTISFRIKG